MAKKTIAEILNIHPAKAGAMSIEDISEVIADASDETLQILSQSCPALLASITALQAITQGVQIYHTSVGVLTDTKKAIESAVPVMGFASAAKLASEKAGVVVENLVDESKQQVKDMFLNTEINI